MAVWCGLAGCGRISNAALFVLDGLIRFLSESGCLRFSSRMGPSFSLNPSPFMGHVRMPEFTKLFTDRRKNVLLPAAEKSRDGGCRELAGGKKSRAGFVVICQKSLTDPYFVFGFVGCAFGATCEKNAVRLSSTRIRLLN